MSLLEPVRARARWLWWSLAPLAVKAVVWLIDAFAQNWATNELTNVLSRWGGAGALSAKVIAWVALNPISAVVVVGVSLVVVLETIGLRRPPPTKATQVGTIGRNRTAAASGQAHIPRASDWLELEDRFGRITGEVEGIWSRYESGDVEWSVHPKGPQGERRVERFLAEARLAGRMVASLTDLHGKFQLKHVTDDADHWLNIVAGLVHPGTGMRGSGHNERGRHETGYIDNLVDASKVACVRLRAEGVVNPQEERSHSTLAMLREADAQGFQLVRSPGGVSAPRANPIISTEVSGGTRAEITVRNAGDPFTLVTHTRLVAASRQIDRAAIYEFQPRPVRGGNGVSGYTVATLGQTGLGTSTNWQVEVRGEGMEVIQGWEGRDGLWFDVEWTFQNDVASVLTTLATVVTRVVLSGDHKRLDVTGHDPGSVPAGPTALPSVVQLTPNPMDEAEPKMVRQVVGNSQPSPDEDNLPPPQAASDSRPPHRSEVWGDLVKSRKMGAFADARPRVYPHLEKQRGLPLAPAIAKAISEVRTELTTRQPWPDIQEFFERLLIGLELVVWEERPKTSKDAAFARIKEFKAEWTVAIDAEIIWTVLTEVQWIEGNLQDRRDLARVLYRNSTEEWQGKAWAALRFLVKAGRVLEDEGGFSLPSSATRPTGASPQRGDQPEPENGLNPDGSHKH